MKTWHKAIIAVCIVLLIAYLFLARVVNVHKDRMELNSLVSWYYMQGYNCGYSDYENENDYFTTKCSDYEKIGTEGKLAFSTGYGYGYYDSSWSYFDEDPKEDYVDISAPYWVDKLYWLTK